ncbi:FHA domain-containing protein [Phototrophicus methaneseepsis]|uniref:FHA domain-containing protein n=1 Tax=Phototrophicus methaneseepsis TaxID=2710758 RepID=A0A7S8EC13_9CHLR|nr:FHA domain-containing protein [Phototrophicus methaneseepsis]QPC84200.1 FHA domain-containing protein [Phototrophicus methaneseepsis]
MKTNDVDRTMEIPKPTTRLTVRQDDLEGARAALPDQLRFTLVDANVTVEINLNRDIIIGRQTSSVAQVHFDLTPFIHSKHGVSRQHCVISEIYGKLMLQDLDSTNGTMLNDKSLKPYQRYEIQSGDRMLLGRCDIQVEFVFKRRYATI